MQNINKFQIDAVAEFLGWEFISEEQSKYDYGWWVKDTFNEGMSAHTRDFICMGDRALVPILLDWNILHKVWGKFKDINTENLSPDDKVSYEVIKEVFGDAILDSDSGQAFIKAAVACLFINNLIQLYAKV